MEKIEKNRRDIKLWTTIIYLVVVIILFITGFVAGYLLYGDKECIQNPLIYSVNKLNEINKDQFTCSCYSSKTGSGFTFNKDGLIDLDH